MSVQAMTAVFQNSQARGNERLVLLSIANYADDYGIAWPGIETIARDINCDDRTASRVVKRLSEKVGELRVIERPGTSNLYVIQLDGMKPWDEAANDRVVSRGGNLPGGQSEIKSPPEPLRTPNRDIDTTQVPPAKRDGRRTARSRSLSHRMAAVCSAKNTFAEAAQVVGYLQRFVDNSVIDEAIGYVEAEGRDQPNRPRYFLKVVRQRVRSRIHIPDHGEFETRISA